MASYEWGIFYTGGGSAFDIDSCQEMSFSSKTKISQFPVEKGGFIDYNKVQEPFTIKLKLAVGGDSLRMSIFLTALEAAKNSVNLYSVMTPESYYQDCTIIDYSYKRTSSSGVNSIVAEVSLTEIRQVTPQYVSVSLPNAKSKLATGKVPGGTKQPEESATASIKWDSSQADIIALAKRGN